MGNNWYSPVRAKNGRIVGGGAALMVRTQALGGMDPILKAVAYDAAQNALLAANVAVRLPASRTRSRLMINQGE